MRYTKADIRTHNDDLMGGPQYPAVNVKMRRFTSPDRIIEEFGCSEETAGRALEYAEEMHRELFWEDATEDAKQTFPYTVKVYSAGRSGGWLIVCGLPPIESWDAVDLSRWRSFELCCQREVEWLCADEEIIDSIRANEWALDDWALEHNIALALGG